MNCREIADFLSDYLDASLPLRQWLVFRLHLLGCRDCRRYLASFAATIKLARSLRKTAAEDVSQVPEALVRAILAARGHQPT